MLEDLCIISGAVPGGEYLFIYSQMHYDAVLYAATFFVHINSSQPQKHFTHQCESS